jgi:hypothetical protein
MWLTKQLCSFFIRAISDLAHRHRLEIAMTM